MIADSCDLPPPSSSEQLNQLGLSLGLGEALVAKEGKPKHAFESGG